ncbi:MAG: hypothetical protein HZB72_02190 [Burkholderiales bacterium]|nr:hypothetical protein [Burkholderiales bacterium]
MSTSWDAIVERGRMGTQDGGHGRFGGSEIRRCGDAAMRSSAVRRS